MNANSQWSSCIRPATPADGDGIAAIYNHYIDNTIVTFEEEAVSGEEMGARVSRVIEQYPWLVAESDGELLGYSYATRWNARCSYRMTAESTVYLGHAHVGRGLGEALYRTLIDQLKSRQVHCLLAGIALPNPASVALHEKLGFRQVAELQEVGRKFEQWINVGYWQRLL